MTSDTALMEECRTNLNYFISEDQGKRNGIQEDGSYIYHDYWPLEGMYANGYLVEQTVYVYSALSGTAFAVGTADSMADWMLETFRPVMHRNVVFSMNSGRNPVSGARYGRIALSGALRLLDRFDAATNLQLRQFIRSMIVGETAAETQKAYSYIAAKLGSMFLVQNLKSVIMDSTIPDAEQEYAAVRYTSDRVVQHQSDYTVGLSMSSTRIAIPESINGQNRYGWYGNDGAVYVYNDTTDYNTDQYGESYQRFANLYRVAGATEEDSTARQP